MKSRSSCNKTEFQLPYHAGLSEERVANQTRFIRCSMVATIAFGMGHKPDVRFVIHYDLPRTLEIATRNQDERSGGTGSLYAVF